MVTRMQPMPPSTARRLPVGAEAGPDGTHFRVWAPNCRRVTLVLEDSDRPPVPLTGEPGGYFAASVPGVGDGACYRYRLDDDSNLYPDPASRFQPQGPFGPSQVVDPGRFAWTDAGWAGRELKGQVIYEMHVGTFTPEGTWQAAARELRELAAAGLTVIEVLPVADFPGRFGWGYDGVDLFAPTRLYGTPDDFRHFIDQAHHHALAVILDVVYNHLGPIGNFLPRFSSTYFSTKHHSDWGAAPNFDGDGCGPVREFVLANAGYWIDEFHLDGLRLDATQQLFDDGPTHIVAEIGRRVRDAAKGRATIVVAENEPQDGRLVRPAEAGGYGLDALWNDDFHHSAVVALTGRSEAYYSDHLGTPQEFISAAKWGFLYQGQHYTWQKQRRGHSGLDLWPARMVTFIENHDQIANSGQGLRVHLRTSPGRYRAMTALFLLLPGTPMLFQGQEFGSTAGFTFFADHEPEVARLTHEGRRKFLAQFPSLATSEVQRRVPDPSSLETFGACKLRASERDAGSGLYRLHKDLIRLRRTDAAFVAQDRESLDGAILGPRAFILRFRPRGAEERALLVNLGSDLELKPCPEPLVAPPIGTRWRQLWSSEEVRYGGGGAPPVMLEGSLRLSGRSACVLGPIAS
jgi:maltooligosyltrehalose trehalohydrolase